MNVPRLFPLKLFAPALSQPALVPAGPGGTMMFSQGRDDGYDYADDDADFDDEPPPPRRVQRRSSGGSGSGGRGNGGRPRTIQFQPEERYWTDYLRIALPIIGLLLMVGLFWFWVQQLIDDDPDTDEPVATATVGAPELAGNVSTPSPTTDGVQGQAPPTDSAAPPPEEETPDDAASEETPAEDQPEDGATFEQGDAATINDTGVNMRAAPTTGASGTINATLEPDTPVTIESGPEEADGYVWWEIIVDDTGETGWVVEDYLEPAE